MFYVYLLKEKCRFKRNHSFINFLKLVIFFVHLLSATPFFFFIILLIIALFYENVDNYLVRFCQFFVFFYILSSIILFIALNIEQTFFILSELVGSFSLKLLHGIITSRIRLCLILVLIKWRKRYSMPTTKEKKMLKTKNLL